MISYGIACPECDSRQNFAAIDEVGLHRDRDAYDSPIGSRGEWASVGFACESCDKRLAVIVANHKGDIQVGVVSIP